MEDHKIIELFWERKEDAVAQAAEKYEKYCYTIAHNLLQSKEDAEECVNDTWLAAWNAIPPHRPDSLSAFLGKITRRKALDSMRKSRAEKRKVNFSAVSLEELEGCIPSSESIDDTLSLKELSAIINAFLKALPEAECNVFLRRYWFFDPVKDIARRYGYREGKVKMMLLRTREKLKNHLEKKGVTV